MLLDKPLNEFITELDAYLVDQHDAHIEDFTIDGGVVRIFVMDTHGNDIVWEMSMEPGRDSVIMGAIIDGKLLTCEVTAHAWCVGAIIMS